MAEKEWTVARTPEELQRRYRFKNIEITKQELDSFLNDLVFDDHLSSTSANPVQNKVITLALANKVTNVSGKGLSSNDFTDVNKHVVDQITDAKIQQWDSNSFSIDSVYPVGSIYMSVNNTNPSILFGGTWEQIQDRFLLSAGSSYTAGTTGGEATVKLELNNYRHNVWNADGSTTYNDIGQLWTPTGSGYGLGLKYSSNTNTPHNNMPPYLVVYMWKRTA